MNAIQSALAHGLSVLTSTTCGNGEVFRVRGSSDEFAASLTSQIVNDGIGGRIIETIMVVQRSTFSALPTEGTVIENVVTGAEYRYVETRPSVGGFINIVVRGGVS